MTNDTRSVGASTAASGLAQSQNIHVAIVPAALTTTPTGDAGPRNPRSKFPSQGEILAARQRMKGVPYKDFNKIASFVSSIGIAFSLSGAISITSSNTPRSRELFGFASVAFVASLALSTICSLLLTTDEVVDFTDPTHPASKGADNNVMTVLCIFSHGSLVCLCGAFLTIGVALIDCVGKGVGIAFITVVGTISLLGFVIFMGIIKNACCFNMCTWGRIKADPIEALPVEPPQRVPASPV